MEAISLIGIALLGLIAIVVLPYFLRQKDEELEGKVDAEHFDKLEKEKEKFRQEREEGMRHWVKSTIMEFVGSAIKELKQDFKHALDEMEKRSDQKYQTILSLVEKINHERLSRKAQYEGTIDICKEALEKAQETSQQTLQLIRELKKV